MDGAKEVAVGTKAFVEGGKEKTLEGIKKVQEQQKNPIPESKYPAKIMQETVESSKPTVILQNAEETFLQKIKQSRSYFSTEPYSTRYNDSRK